MAVAEGDVLEIDADSAVGHEQRGRRPVLVVSVDALHSTLGLAVVCAITTHGGRATGARNAAKLCAVPRATLQAVRARLKVLLGVGR